MLLIQKYLLDHSLEELATEHGVDARIAAHKASFNYNQIEAKDDNPIACEARGLILSTLNGTPFPASGLVGETLLLAKPFSRFFNFGQGAASKVDFNDKELRILDKLDGTLIIVYCDPFMPNEVCIATRSVPNADLVNGSGKTFAELFKETIANQTGRPWKEFSTTLLALHKDLYDITLCFELCTPYNQVVIQHNDSKAYLLYICDNVTLEEFQYQHIVRWNNLYFEVEVAPILHYGPLTIDDCLKIVTSRPGKDFEGVVALDSKGKRNKMKNAEYLALHKITSSLVTSKRSMATLIMNGSEDDILPLLAPQLQQDVLTMKAAISETCKAHEAFFHNTFTPDISRKDFAIACQQEKQFSMGYLMDCYVKGYKTFTEWAQSKKTPDGEYPKSLLDSWCDS